MQILGNGLHYGEARRLWLRSEDNDSVGLTLLPTLFTPLPPSPPSAAATSQTPSLPIPRLSEEPLLSDNVRACRRGFWSSCDAALCDRSQTQIFSFPLKEPQLRRLVEKLLTQLQYFTTLQPAVTSISASKQKNRSWMCLYVNVSAVCVCAFLKSVFHLLSFSCRCLCFPSLLKVRPRFTMRSESGGFFYLKVSFQAYEKRD